MGTIPEEGKAWAATEWTGSESNSQLPAALLNVAPTWKKPQRPLLGGKHSVVYPCNGPLFIRKKECSLIHVTTWMHFANIILSEKKSEHKTPYVIRFHLYERSRTGKSIGIESTHRWLLGEWERLLRGRYSDLVRGGSEGNILNVNSGDGSTTV